MDELQALVEEFQAEVASKKRQLRVQAENLCLNLKNALHVELMRLPRNIRNMPITEFMSKYEGSVDAVAQAEYMHLYDTLSTPSGKKGKSRPALTDQTYIPPQTASLARATKPMDMFRTIQSARRAPPQSALRQALSESLFDEAVSGTVVPATPLVSATYGAKAPGTSKRKALATKTPATQKRARTMRSAKTPKVETSRKVAASTTRRPRRGDKLKPANAQISTLLETVDGSTIDIASPTTRRMLTRDHKKAAMEKLNALQSQVSTIMRDLRA